MDQTKHESESHNLADQDLILRLHNYEDHSVERKTSADSKDWLKTVVAFANSAPDDFPCVLYIGVRDTGEIETPQVNLDSIQKSFNKEMKKVYPPPPYFPKVIEENGRQALAVVVLGSRMRPHFAGPSYVRKGSESIEATDEQLNELIARRGSKANLILQSRGSNVTVINRQVTGNGQVYESSWPPTEVADCNQFYITLETGSERTRKSFPLERVGISFDNQLQRLQLEISK